MGKIIMAIDDNLEERLRRYIAGRYPTEVYGKLKQVIEWALEEWLEKHATAKNV